MAEVIPKDVWASCREHPRICCLGEDTTPPEPLVLHGVWPSTLSLTSTPQLLHHEQRPQVQKVLRHPGVGAASQGDQNDHPWMLLYQWKELSLVLVSVPGQVPSALWACFLISKEKGWAALSPWALTLRAFLENVAWSLPTGSCIQWQRSPNKPTVMMLQVTGWEPGLPTVIQTRVS